jgi:hypothetical protein
MNGPLGGMQTPDGIPAADPFEDTQRIGTWVGERVAEIARGSMRRITEPAFQFAVRPLEIPVVT